MSAAPNYAEALRAILGKLAAEGVIIVRREELEEAWLEAGDLGEERLKEAIKHLRRRGEVTIEMGGMRYKPALKLEPGYVRIYRVLRASQGPVSLEDLSRLAECPPDRAGRVVRMLAASGYAQETGRNRGGKLWLATAVCRAEPKPPAIDYSDLDFVLERRAVARLVEIMLVGDPKRPAAAKAVREQLEILNSRFGGQGGKYGKEKAGAGVDGGQSPGRGQRAGGTGPTGTPNQCGAGRDERKN